MNKQFIIGNGETSAKDVQKIIENICKANPGLTIQEYLDKQNKLEIILI